MTGDRRFILTSPWITFAIAIAIRLIYLLLYRQSPFYIVPLWDAADYHNIALAFSRAELHPALPFRPPLYPLLLGITYLIFGVSALVPRLLQIVLGSVTCMLVHKITGKMFGDKYGAAAGWLAAISGLMFYFDLELLPTSLTVFLIVLLVHELIRMRDEEVSGMRIGLIFALGCLARPTLLVLFPVVIWWIYRSDVGYRRLIGAVGTTVVVLGLSLLMHIAAGWGPVLVSAQGGVNFYIGNSRGADGMTARLPGMSTGWNWDQIRGQAQSVTGESMTPAEVDQFYYDQGVREIKADPVRWMKLTLRKSLLYWNRSEISSNQDLNYHGKRIRLFGILKWLGFSLLLTPAFIGMATTWRDPKTRLIVFLILIYFLATIPFFITGRFRHPMTPLLIIMAMGGISAVVTTVRESASVTFNRWLMILVPGITGIILLLSVDSGLEAGRYDYGLFTEGTAWQRIGEDEKAESLFHEALEANPNAPFVNSRLGELAEQRGDQRTAIMHYRLELNIQPGYAKVWNNLGTLFQTRGDLDQALECFEAALLNAPFLTEAVRNAGRIWELRAHRAAEDEDLALARTCAQRSLEIDPDNNGSKLLLRTLP